MKCLYLKKIDVFTLTSVFYLCTIFNNLVNSEPVLSLEVLLYTEVVVCLENLFFSSSSKQATSSCPTVKYGSLWNQADTLMDVNRSVEVFPTGLAIVRQGKGAKKQTKELLVRWITYTDNNTTKQTIFEIFSKYGFSF